MKQHRLLWLWLFLLVQAPASATDTLFRPIKHFSNADGLPQNSVKALAQDAAGFIWIATESGLTRFDGVRFDNFTARTLALTSNRFTQIIGWPGEDRLYAFNDQQEVLFIENGKPVKGLLSASGMLRSLQQQTGWMGPADQHSMPAVKNGVWQFGDSLLLPVGAGDIFLVTPRDYSLLRQGRVSFRVPFLRTVDDLVFLLNQQLFCFNAQSGQFFRLDEKGPHLHSLVGLPPAKKGEKMRLLYNPLQPDYTLLCFNKDLYLIQPKKEGILARKLITGFDIDEEQIVSHWFDRVSQTILLGSHTNGLFLFAQASFTASTRGSDEANEVFYAQALSAPNTIITGQGFAFHPPNTTPLLSYRFLTKYTDKYSLITDDKGYCWTKRDSFVYRLSLSAARPIREWKFPETVTQIARGPGAFTLVSLRDGTVCRIDDSVQTVKPLFQLPSEAICIRQQGNELIWLGTNSGLYRYDCQRQQYQLFPGSSGKQIRGIYLDSSLLWVSSYGDGFFLIDHDQWISFPPDPHQYLLNTHCILKDRNGYMWMTTNNGLFQASRADLLAYTRHPDFPPYYHYYDQSDGLPTTEFNGGCIPCGLVLPDGLFSFPSISGLVWFHPTDIQPVISRLPIYIDRIWLNNQEIPVASELTLPRNMQQLKLEIATPFLGNRANLHLMYALYQRAEQLVWVPVENDIINFATLPAGSYTLELRKQEGFGPTSYSSLKIHIHVPRHWLLHPLSLIILIGLVLAAGILLYRFRTRYIRRSNSLLEKKVMEQTRHLQGTLENLKQSQQELVVQSEWQQKMLAVLSHDIKAPLKYLMLATDRIRQGLLKDNITAYQEPSKTIFEYSSRLYYTMDNLLQFIKTELTGGAIEKEQINLHRLVEEKRLIFHDIAAGVHTDIVNNIPVDTTIHSHSALLAIILHNLIDNSVKVTDSGQVTIACETVENAVIITVSDTGIGLSPQLVQWINDYSMDERSLTATNPSGSGIGLYIVKGLAKLLDIAVMVYSSEKGTHFKLVMRK